MGAVLGISCHSHDAAAALVVDGQLVAAIQEERLSRVKNDPSLPLAAARACLELGGVPAAALDEVAFYENPYAKLERVLLASLRAFPRALRQFPRAIASQLGGKVWVLDALASGLGVPRGRVRAGDHHRSHAASAFLCSPFQRAAVLTIDAVGEETSTALWLGEGTKLQLLDSVAFPHSLGLLYSALTAYLGFEVNEGEYKVMGLAAFGAPRLEEALGRVARLHPDGRFELDLAYFDAHTRTEVGFSRKLEALLGPRRPPGRPWALDESEDDRRCADIAATLQAFLERAELALAREARRRTGADALCLAGGCALNAVANARLSREAGFSEVFVQPAAGDAGGALGAALWAAAERGDGRPSPLAHAAWGVPVRGDAALELARRLGLPARRVEDPAEAAAERIARGQVVGLVQGRSEWGPRALGQRSLLALPAPEAVKDRLNRVVKRREPFRPFAPAALESAAQALFEPWAPRLAPFMTTVAAVRPEARARLQAVTHHDGTARLQTVSPESAFGKVIAAVGRRTGTEVVLNTSLNGRGEPIAATEADALGFLLSHPCDAMVIDDILVTRGGGEAGG